MHDEQGQTLGRGRLLILAAACGAAAANIYYNQPMLGDIARTLGARGGAIGLVPTATQIGFALGLLFLLPLGDRLQRRSLILTMSASLSVFLGLAAVAPSLAVLAVASALLGSVASMAQQIIAFGSQLAGQANRGKAVGSMMSGLLLGVLLARTLSGTVTAFWSWRSMFGVAALLMVAVTAVLSASLPKLKALTDLPYRGLLGSLWTLVRTDRVLREASLIGAMLFGAFSVFWSTLALHLEAPPLHFHSGVAGLFGLLGASGVLAAPMAGRAADRGRGHAVLWASCASVAVAFAVFAIGGMSLAGLVAGVILLDLGVWSAQIANQQRIFATRPAARGRVNAVYMVSYFAGGAGGSALGTQALSHGGWGLVSLAGGAMGCAALLALARGRLVARRAGPQLGDPGGA